ncbi:glycoside hydrolase domain-containing protein [Devriesea agamarum]|uniref:glycoside hydrolase domain-containing protein n=1 Tax=Devriesea agamarum TaxID=472569 RepID=UPI00071CB45A|nr:glycoside hydrolase domain-containing protein [Devriesea agamarum]
MDQQILDAQKWLNATYATVAGWVKIPEDGITGWNTIYALRRAMQAEMGISPVASGWGAQSTSAFQTKFGVLNASSSVPENVVRVISGALWCKGYSGLYANSPVSFATLIPSLGSARSDLGLGADNPVLEVKLMASLLSMDAYKIPIRGKGTNGIRGVQQWLNKTYSGRRDFALVPCDGLFPRQVQNALMLALQYEIGMADGVANGNFGPGTKAGLKEKASLAVGSSDGATHFVRLFQAALIFNRYGVDLNGVFSEALAGKVRLFQNFMEIPETGKGDFTTWASLLVSSGDTGIKTKGIDTNIQLDAAQAAGVKASGYTHIGRYTVGAGKFITSPELDLLKAQGLRLFPLHQRFNNNVSTMTREAGRTQGLEALERGRVLGFPKDTLIFFSVDMDVAEDTIIGPVKEFFRGVKEVMDSAVTGSFKIGVYGTRNICQILADEGLTSGSFIAGMSTGWSGNMGFPMPSNWHYNQVVEVSNEPVGSAKLNVDHVMVSKKAASVDLSTVISPPVERDGSPSATGFDAVFEWVVRAEVAAERALRSNSSILFRIDIYAPLISDYILNYLRKPNYGKGSYGGKWDIYLPEGDIPKGSKVARSVAEQFIGKLSPARPDSKRDVAHFAATALGYRTWGLSTTFDDYGLGDLGGWPLDLLQLWGNYERLKDSPKPDLFTWTSTILGTDKPSAFDRADVIADADAWLVAKALKVNPESTLSDCLRVLLKEDSKTRVRRFYKERFGGKPENVSAAFKKLADGIDYGASNIFKTPEALKEAAGIAALPNQLQAEQLGRGYAAAMERFGS